MSSKLGVQGRLDKFKFGATFLSPEGVVYDCSLLTVKRILASEAQRTTKEESPPP